MTTNEIAQNLIARFTPDNDRSGFAAPLGDDYILICDGQCSWIARADEAAAWLDTQGDYNDFCHHCDPVQDDAAAFLLWDDFGYHATDGSGYILSDDVRDWLDDGQTVWEVQSSASDFIGYAPGDTAEDAIRFILEDGDVDDSPDHYRAVRMAG